jgi:hypothetical protein
MKARWHALLIVVVHALLLDFLQQSDFRGADGDAALVAKLHESGVDVFPGSAWRQPKQIERGYYCGSLCASASTYTMHRDGTSWRVVDRQMRWIARAGELRDATQSS